MTHLKAEDLVDLADGTRPESSAPHLASCGTCRAQLADLRAMMSAAAEADVPEPSPLYWDHLSARVRGAVELEQANARLKGSRSFGSGSFGANPSGVVAAAAGARAFRASVALAAAVLLALVIARVHVPPAARMTPPPAAVADSAVAPEASDAWQGDVWLTFVADLAAGVDADAVRDEGLDASNADEAVMHLDDGELRELERLLQAQIRNQGD